MINELKQSNSNIKAELTSIQKSKDLDRNPRVISSDKPSLILGDSTIRDVVPHNERHLYVCSKGGAKTSDILSMLKKVKPNAYADITIHVGTNDTATKYPETKIAENVSSILDVAKDKSLTGNVTLSGICPRKDNDSAADKGKNINATMASLASDKGCTFIDHMDTFVSRNGEVIDDFLSIDGLHLSASGTRKLMHNLGISELASGHLDAPKTTGSTWSRQSNHQRHQKLDSRHLTNQPTGRPAAGSAPGQQSVSGHHQGQPIRMPQPHAHLQRDWHRGSNADHPTKPAGYYQRQQSPRLRPQVHNKRDYHDYRNDSSRNYCEMCGEGNHTTQQCRFRDPVNCHSCQRFGHKMKFCNWYR